MRILLVLLSLSLAACANRGANSVKASSGAPVNPSMATNRHPLAKFIEVTGYRLDEASPGMLKITFAVINHSTADIGDLRLKLSLTTTVAKPGDPPIAEFDATVPSIGPHESKDVTVTVPSKLRVYELPDWQFLRGSFEITSPPPQQ